ETTNHISRRPRSNVIKLVMSTSELMGRRPIAVSRFCSQSGEGPFLTPRTKRNQKVGHNDGFLPKSRVTFTGQGKEPLTGFGILSLYVPIEVAPRSRAIPDTPVQSGRFGVRLISITGALAPAHST